MTNQKPETNRQKATRLLAEMQATADSFSPAPANLNCLDISPDCLTNPTRIDVLAIEQAMLWPTPAMRKKLSPVQAHEWGVVTGMRLRRIIGLANLKKENATGKAVNQWIAGIMRKPPRRPISERTIINGIWKNYRSVACLWASYYHRGLNTDEAHRFFPCRTAELCDFLAYAEAFRCAAETTQTHLKTRAVLSKGESIALPALVAPPTVTLEFEWRIR